MPRHSWVAALFFGLAMAGSAHAQQGFTVTNGTPSSFLTGISPQQVTFKPIDTSKLVATPPGPALRQKSFSLASLISNINLPSFSSIFSHNQTPAPVLPGQHPNAYQPVLPSAVPIPPYADAYRPLLPFTPGH
jgi:hypothetical protein